MLRSNYEQTLHILLKRRFFVSYSTHIESDSYFQWVQEFSEIESLEFNLIG